MIAAVKGDLESSEQTLKAFNEQNRQISSPALQLEQERLARDVEIQKGIYLTLKQQFELAKIEEVHATNESSANRCVGLVVETRPEEITVEKGGETGTAADTIVPRDPLLGGFPHRSPQSNVPGV